MTNGLRQKVISRRDDTHLISNLIAKNCSLRVHIIIAARKIMVTDLGLCFFYDVTIPVLQSKTKWTKSASRDIISLLSIYCLYLRRLFVTVMYSTIVYLETPVYSRGLSLLQW